MGREGEKRRGRGQRGFLNVSSPGNSPLIEVEREMAHGVDSEAQDTGQFNLIPFPHLGFYHEFSGESEMPVGDFWLI